MITLNSITALCLRGAIVVFVLTAVALGALFATQPAAADRNAEAVRALL